MSKDKQFRALVTIIVGIVLLIVSSSPMSAAIPESERAGLISLYNATGGDNWVKHTGWKTPPLDSDGFAMSGTEETWFGITVTNDHVTEIVLSSNKLSGCFTPSGLSNLNYLKRLMLDRNNLSGSIPSSLASLVNLEELNLLCNQFSGNIPAFLGNLTNLKKLILGSNLLTGIPPELGKLSNLEELGLRSNRLCGAIPSELGNLSRLKCLDLGFNKLAGAIPSSLGNLSNLENLYLFSNLYSGNIPSELGDLNKLIALDICCISNPDFGGSIPSSLGNLTNLQQLDLHFSNLSGSIPAELGNLTNLKTLSLDNNNLTGSIPAELGNLTKLQKLECHKNYISGSIPPELGNLIQCETLNLSYNWLTGSIPSELGDMSNLKYLYLRSNQLNGSIPTTLGNLSNIVYLMLNCNALTGGIPATLSNLNKLYYLDLGYNNLTGEIPSELGNLKTLSYFSLSSNQLTGTIPVNLAGMINLTDLYLYKNKLTGPIPSELGTLQWLQYLDLGRNLLSGPIPPELANASDLTYLNLEINYLTGSIPASFERLTELSRLNLRTNQLSGEIPPALAHLPFLVSSRYSIDIDWNCGFSVTDPDLLSLLDAKDPGWENTQYDCSNPKFVINYPQENYKWEVGHTAKFMWETYGPMICVKIELTTDDGAHWITLAPSILNMGYFGWEPTNILSDRCRFRISDASTGTPTATSSLFSVVPVRSLNLTSVISGETWDAETFHTITWSNTGPICDVNLEYSINNGTNWLPIVLTISNTGSYNWKVPNTPSTQCKIRIKDATGISMAISPGVFSILELPSFTVKSPVGTENWEVGSIHPITWTTKGSISNVKIDYSTDNGSSWTIISPSTSNSGSYNWTIPDKISAQCKVRISGDSRSEITDMSDAVFAIQAASTLTLTSPNGSEGWEVDTIHPIKWASTGSLANVKLEYTSDNGASWKVISSSAANNGTYNWTVPDIISSLYKVRISGAPDSTAADVSDAAFKVVMPPPFALTSPNSAVTWEIGSTQAITWTAPYTIKNLKIEYTLNNGSTWTMITTSTPNTGSYMWKIPVADSFSVKVRISDALTGTPSDMSDNSFRIRPEITYLRLTSPNGGENWQVGSTQTITWTYSGPAANVKLEYIAGTTWVTIVESTPNTGSYTWKVANTPTTACRINVSGAPQGYVNPDSSDNVFTISVPPPVITVKTPNGGQNLKSGGAYNITWSTTGSVPKVRLEYSVNDGSTWALINSSLTNSGTYKWTVPATSSMKCRVRVRNSVSSTPVDISDSSFVIYSATKPHIYVTPSSLSFDAYKSQMVKYQKTFNISNISAGTLKWSLKSNQAWLTCSPTSGTGAGKITVTVNVANLAPGSYTGTLTVTATGSDNTPLAIPIYLNVY